MIYFEKLADPEPVNVFFKRGEVVVDHCGAMDAVKSEKAFVPPVGKCRNYVDKFVFRFGGDFAVIARRD